MRRSRIQRRRNKQRSRISQTNTRAWSQHWASLPTAKTFANTTKYHTTYTYVYQCVFGYFLPNTNRLFRLTTPNKSACQRRWPFTTVVCLSRWVHRRATGDEFTHAATWSHWAFGVSLFDVFWLTKRVVNNSDMEAAVFSTTFLRRTQCLDAKCARRRRREDVNIDSDTYLTRALFTTICVAYRSIITSIDLSFRFVFSFLNSYITFRRHLCPSRNTVHKC